MTPDHLALLNLLATLVGFAVTVASVAFLIGRLAAKVDGLTNWLGKVSQGDSPLCQRHEERINEHGVRLADHETRIRGLEQQ